MINHGLSLLHVLQVDIGVAIQLSLWYKAHFRSWPSIFYSDCVFCALCVSLLTLFAWLWLYSLFFLLMFAFKVTISVNIIREESQVTRLFVAFIYYHYSLFLLWCSSSFWTVFPFETISPQNDGILNKIDQNTWCPLVAWECICLEGSSARRPTVRAKFAHVLTSWGLLPSTIPWLLSFPWLLTTPPPKWSSVWTTWQIQVLSKYPFPRMTPCLSWESLKFPSVSVIERTLTTSFGRLSQSFRYFVMTLFWWHE